MKWTLGWLSRLCRQPRASAVFKSVSVDGAIKPRASSAQREMLKRERDLLCGHVFPHAIPHGLRLPNELTVLSPHQPIHRAKCRDDRSRDDRKRHFGRAVLSCATLRSLRHPSGWGEDDIDYVL